MKNYTELKITNNNSSAHADFIGKWNKDDVEEEMRTMAKISTVIDGVKYILVPERKDETCSKCALAGKLGTCQMKNYEHVSFDGIMICRGLCGAWKKAT